MWLAFTCWLQPHTCPLNFTCTTDEGVSEIHWAPDSDRFLRCVMGTNQLLLGRLLQEDGEARLCLRRVAEDWSDSESSAREQAVTAWVTAAGERHSSRNRCVGPAQLASSCSSLCHAFFSWLSQAASFILVPYLPRSVQPTLYITCCLSYLGWFLSSYWLWLV